jgi:hypothetical protein
MLWVVDNSGSMGPLQSNLTTNFNSFISSFIAKGFDFHLSVTSTDSYLSGSFWNNNPLLAQFSDGGYDGSGQTGVRIIDQNTSNITTTFVHNATLGSSGSGDERAFSSFKAALNSSYNTAFLRPDSFMAVLILSDEDDFSDPTRCEGCGTDHNYSDPNLETVDSYVSYLDTLTNTTGALRRYSANAIAVLDSTCQQSHAQQSPSTIIGQRYIDLANQTSGVLGSVCDTSYANALSAITEHILELGTQFYLNVIPVPSTIVVIVNGVVVPNDPTNGWTYISAANSIMFHGSAIPAQGSSIEVDFDPAGLQF